MMIDFGATVSENNAKGRVTVTFPAEVHHRLREIASQADVSISWVIRSAVDEFLERHESADAEQLRLPFRLARR